MAPNNRTIVELHILETTAAANLNRDDTGSPKTVEYGGSTRARVSSQAWKRPTREMFDQFFDRSELGVRTKKVVEELAGRIVGKNADISEEDTEALAEETLKAAGIKLTPPRQKKDVPQGAQESGYLLFLGNSQYDKLADLAVAAVGEAAGDVEAAKTALKSSKKQIKAILQDDHAVDVALFGRMVADDADLNVDAATQVAHAISVHAVDAESDFFTAVDDRKKKGDEDDEAGDNGAAMLGQIEFNAATYYRYANVDANRLYETLGDVDATAKAIGAFIQSFVMSMPQGKIHGFAQGTMPELVVIMVRDSQGVNLVGAFERPVTPDFVEHATRKLVDREKGIEKAYGLKPLETWVVRVDDDDTAAASELADGNDTSLLEAVAGVEACVKTRLEQE